MESTFYTSKKNRLRACIFSPILPRWDRGAFCSELIELLEVLGYTVTVYDSLSILMEAPNFSNSLEIWRQALKNIHSFDLVVGQAFGGALVQGLLNDVFSPCPKALLISAPSFTNKKLKAHFQDLVEGFSQNKGKKGITLLEELILPYGEGRNEEVSKIIVPELTKVEIQRAVKGFSLLQDMDVREKVPLYQGDLVTIFGAESQLVTSDSIFLSPQQKTQFAVSLSGCGMRPIKENPRLSLSLISFFLKGYAL